MKYILIIFLTFSVEAEDVLSFSELLGSIEERKAQRAKNSLTVEEQGDFHIDRYKRHFLLGEEDKIAHIIFILANEEVIDGELAFYVTRMFACDDFDKGAYDKELSLIHI